MTSRNPILLALDTTDVTTAQQWAAAAGGAVGGLKIGKEFFTSHGPQGVRQAVGDRPLFLDLKWHDIPNTVAGAVRASLALRPLIVNVHASGGPAMMKAAKAAADGAAGQGLPRPLLIAVTVLTSMDEDDLAATGQLGPLAEQVLRLAKLTDDCGLDGVVCSPQEIALLRRQLRRDFKLIVPGIRPAWAASGDQKRVMTPAEALAAGADYLVIGRAITAAADPKGAADRILKELGAKVP